MKYISVLVTILISHLAFASGDHIQSDGRDGFFTKDGHIQPDNMGGYFTPEGHYQSDGRGGYFTPDGKDIQSDGMGDGSTNDRHLIAIIENSLESI